MFSRSRTRGVTRWALHGSTTLIVGSFEAFGRWEPTLFEHYKRFVKSAFPDKKNRQYVYQLKMAVQRVSVALQSAIEATMLFNRRARAFPAVELGPAAEEHAAALVARCSCRYPNPVPILVEISYRRVCAFVKTSLPII